MPGLTSRPPLWKLEAINCELYENATLLANDLPVSLYNDELNNLIKSTIVKAAESFIPQTTGHLPKHPKPWWNDECRRAKKTPNKFGGYYANTQLLETSCPSSKNVQKHGTSGSRQKRIPGLTSRRHKSSPKMAYQTTEGVSCSESVLLAPASLVPVFFLPFLLFWLRSGAGQDYNTRDFTTAPRR